MILVDTSAWIEFDRATGSVVHHRLRGLIAHDEPVAVTEPIVAEVVMGARDDRRELDLRRFLARFTNLPFDRAADFDGAVQIYRQCRRVGVTPRGLVDCMIAAVARRRTVAVLVCDRDFEVMAEVVGVELDVV